MGTLSYCPSPNLDHKIDEARDRNYNHRYPDSDNKGQDAYDPTQTPGASNVERLERIDELEDVVGENDFRDPRVKSKETRRQEISRVWGVLHDVPVHRQMLTPWYILILVLTVFQMLRMNYFIATIRAQYTYMLGSEDASVSINRFFDVALPIGGLVTTPFIGLLLNNFSVPSTFGVLTLLVVAISVFNCLPYAWAGYTTVILFVMFRPLYYSAIS